MGFLQKKKNDAKGGWGFLGVIGSITDQSHQSSKFRAVNNGAKPIVLQLSKIPRKCKALLFAAGLDVALKLPCSSENMLPVELD